MKTAICYQINYNPSTNYYFFLTAFGGVLGETTGNRIGITETIIISSAAGILWSLLSGCPLIILGVTGPSLLFDQALWAFSQSTAF